MPEETALILIIVMSLHCKLSFTYSFIGARSKFSSDNFCMKQDLLYSTFRRFFLAAWYCSSTTSAQSSRISLEFLYWLICLLERKWVNFYAYWMVFFRIRVEHIVKRVLQIPSREHLENACCHEIFICSRSGPERN